jgi:DNA primase
MTVEEIKKKHSMPEILNRLNIPIKKSFCNCPFHMGDRTASLKVYPTSFYCFGCGKGGDIITFVENYYNMSFADACEWISGEKLTSRTRQALVVAEMKRKALEQKRAKVKKELAEMELAIDWGLVQICEPFSDVWTDAYNRWLLNCYKQEELMKELGL